MNAFIAAAFVLLFVLVGISSGSIRVEARIDGRTWVAGKELSK